MERTGTVLPADVCFRNRDAGGECEFPEPAILPSTAGAWSLFDLTKHCNLYVVIPTGGIEPLGRAWSEIESAARAIGEPWDVVTLEQQQMIFEAWNAARRKATGG